MIPVNEPLIGSKELEFVNDAVSSGWISSEGKYIQLFEQEFAKFHGVKHAITINNGTNALILALRALNLPKGSEVIMPSMTIISCALACVYNDLVPVFVDCEPDTWCMDMTQVEAAINANTKALMPVHFYGHSVNMDSILQIAEKHNLFVIEDFAEAIGAEYKGRKCGTMGHLNCASFYANKTITTGEGGICLTNDDAIATEVRKLKNLAFVPERRFIHYELGFNYRMTNVQAALGYGQMFNIEAQIKRKIEVAKLYNEFLKPLTEKGLIQLQTQKPDVVNIYWVNALVLNSSLGINASTIMKLLADKGVQTRPFFYPMHKQPVFENFAWFNKSQFLPVTEKIAEYGFYLPSGLTLDNETIKKVADILIETIYENQ
jgi:perosamine synthetase